MPAMIDSSGYSRSAVFLALGRLKALGYIIETDPGVGRGRATEYTIPGIADDQWRPTLNIQEVDLLREGKGPDSEAKRSRSEAEKVQISDSALSTTTVSNVSTQRVDPEPQPALDLEPVPTEPTLTLVADPPKSRYPEAFERWWRTYPRSESKAAAFKAWLAAVKILGTDELQARTEAWVTAYRAAGRADRFMFAPTRWLKDGCYDDPLPEPERPARPDAARSKPERNRQVLAAALDRMVGP